MRQKSELSVLGRPSIDPELMIRMLIVGYSFGIRSERRLCDEVHRNLLGAPSAFYSTACQNHSSPRSLPEKFSEKFSWS
jgi:hypothetical protein